MKNTVAHDSSPIVIRSGASDFADPKRDEARDQAPRAELPHPGTPGAAARWWDSHPAELPQSTILWNDEAQGDALCEDAANEG